MLISACTKRNLTLPDINSPSLTSTSLRRVCLFALNRAVSNTNSHTKYIYRRFESFVEIICLFGQERNPCEASPLSHELYNSPRSGQKMVRIVKRVSELFFYTRYPPTVDQNCLNKFFGKLQVDLREGAR